MYTNNSSFFSSFRTKGNNMSERYKFPIVGEVPPGEYISEIVKAFDTTTKSGKPALEVHYTIKCADTGDTTNEQSRDNVKSTTYRIKQVYPVGTSFLDDLANSVTEALGVEEVDSQDIAGVTERITLSYGDSSFGGFSSRCPCHSQDSMRLPENHNEICGVMEDGI